MGWGTHVNPWLIHVNVWQKPPQCCNVISLQLIKINEKKIDKKSLLPANNYKKEKQQQLWYIYTMEYYSAIKKNTFESVLIRWMNLESLIQSEVRKRNINIIQ